MIDDLALRWIVTTLFVASISGFGYLFVAQRGRWTCAVNHLLHLVMSVAMIVMAWPAGMGLPAVGPIVFFLLSAFWFVLVATRPSRGVADRLTNGYNAVMSSAMVWMYAVMNGDLAGQGPQVCHHGHSGASGMEMAGMDMSQMSSTAAQPGWISSVNLIATIGFAVAALYWLYRYLAERTTNRVSQTAQLSPMGLLCQGFMAVGFALMFAAML